MTRELRGWPRALTDCAEATGSRSGASGRRCPRCNARLRRGNTSPSGLCAPCAAHIAAPPPLAPAWRPQGRTCPECGGLKAYSAIRCHACYTAGPKHNQETP